MGLGRPARTRSIVARFTFHTPTDSLRNFEELVRTFRLKDCQVSIAGIPLKSFGSGDYLTVFSEQCRCTLARRRLEFRQRFLAYRRRMRRKVRSMRWRKVHVLDYPGYAGDDRLDSFLLATRFLNG